MIVLFNINDNKILQCVDNEKIVYVFKLAIAWNKENSEKNEYNFVGITFVPEAAWLWDEGRLKDYLDKQKEWGQVMVIIDGWRYE